MRTDILERKEEILQWVKEGKSKAAMAIELGCNPKTIANTLERWGIEYAGNPSGKGYSKNMPKMTLEEYLLNSKDIQTNKVRKKLLEEGLKSHKCEKCGLSEWLGEKIPLEVHHKDGNRNNNTLENYELLCPNCHAFTDSYRGKNSAK